MIAEEFLNNQELYIKNKHIFPLGTGKIIQQVMIQFAKYHVEQALKTASENVELIPVKYTDDYEVSKDSILNAYPLENIK